MKPLLIELGIAELPLVAVEHLSQAFLDGMKAEFDNHHVRYVGGKRFATARRLAVLFEGVAGQQSDQKIERRGPAMKAAKDHQGHWTKAATGFAASCGVNPDDLIIEDTAKGQWLFYRGSVLGQLTTTLIPSFFKNVMDTLPIAKRMRWGEGLNSFTRPVVSLVILSNDSVIDTVLFGIKSGRITIGHRFHGEKTLTIPSAEVYEKTLADSYVIADISKRRQMIIEQINQLANSIDGQNARAVISDEVLAEVNALVEYPVAILGQFDPRYLHIPQAVLIKTMQDNQKYFAVVSEKNEMLPYFITVANIQSTCPEVVRVGNQRVIEPRFADAEFFLENDKKHRLASRLEALKKVVYQQRLGTVYERSERIVQLAKFVAEQAQFNVDNIARAARLAKCDLVSEMVFEFGELQGVIGEYYARNDGENTEVATAIREQYLPKFAGDELPKTDAGLALSLADKIENIIGGFVVGAKPTGTKDPYALRRASLGVIRLLNESKLDLSLDTLLAFAVSLFAKDLSAEKQLDEIKTYIHERLKGYYQEQGIRHDIFEAVSVVNHKKIREVTKIVTTLTDFIGHQSANNLFAANKRISNILKKNPTDIKTVKVLLLTETQETAIYQAGEIAKAAVFDALAKQDYSLALNALSELRWPLDNFFEHVMIMSDNDIVKNNRLALLADIRGIFMQVADFSVIDASS
ncbi:MAG: glycine--tRNA ligase subunit beta [Ostreibacterium sp.]